MRFAFLLLLAAVIALNGACDRDTASNVDPEAKARAEREAATRPAPKSAIEIGDPLASYKRRAEAGDVSAMIFLGRNYESLGSSRREEARKWYKMAADAGDASAQEALAKFEAAASQPAIVELPEFTTPLPAPTTAAIDLAPGVLVVPSATSRPTTQQPGDLSKVRWQDVLAAVDTTDFVNVVRDDYKPKNEDHTIFVGLSTARDKTITIAGSGRKSDNVVQVTVIIRVRNRQNLGDSSRVAQAAAVVNQVTRNNVMQREFIAWVTEYLSTGRRIDPIYRNGWQILISGPSAEGKADPSKHLGEAIVIEMKK